MKYLALILICATACGTSYMPERNEWIYNKEFTPEQGMEYDTTIYTRCQTVSFPDDPLGKKTRKYYIRFVKDENGKKVERAYFIEPWKSIE